jgi:hypothetical protein
MSRLPNPIPAAIQAALRSLYDDAPAPEGAEKAMEEALRWPTPLSMAFCFFSSGWSMAPLSVRKAMFTEMRAARAAADAALNAAQAARYAADPFVRFDD